MPAVVPCHCTCTLHSLNRCPLLPLLLQEAAAQDTLASLQRVVPGLYCLLSVVKASAALGDWGFVQSLRGPLQALGAAAAFLQSAQQALDMFEAALMPELASQARIAKAQSLLPVPCPMLACGCTSSSMHELHVD